MIIAVASGKGGTGKTLLSTSLALSAPDSCYADLDVEEPNGALFIAPEISEERVFNVPVPSIDSQACAFCGKCAQACVFNAIAIIPKIKSATVYEDLCHGCGVCSFVCPVSSAIQDKHKPIGQLRTGYRDSTKFIEGRLNIGIPSAVPLIGHVAEAAIPSAGTVILDSSPGTSCNMVESVRKSDYIILITEPTPFGLHDLSLAVQVALDLGKPCGIVINKSRGRDQIIEGFCRERSLPILLKIPYSLDIQHGYAEGKPLIEVQPEMKPILEKMLKDIQENK
jgi:MinD superfamily P-loop ATPase